MVKRGIRKKAQSTLEYVLVLTAIVGVIIWAAGQIVRPRIETAMKNVDESITNSATILAPDPAP